MMLHFPRLTRLTVKAIALHGKISQAIALTKKYHRRSHLLRNITGDRTY
ncbi:hypothetical protein [Calothrix sp. NIES-2100]